MNPVAVIGKIQKLEAIKDADRIVLATAVCGEHGIWRGVVSKADFKEGDLCEVYLQDAILPETERFAFMRDKGHKRVKMMRFKGVPSECLIMPKEKQIIEHFQNGGFIMYPTPNAYVGQEIDGIQKYEKEIPASIAGLVQGDFPRFIPKTDELNFQSAPQLVQALIGQPFYATVKYDGSSATIYKFNDHFGCCSRNLELKETEGNSIWKIARKYDLEKRLLDGQAVQFEVVGPGIQGNPCGMKEVEPRLFDLYDINKREHMGIVDLVQWSLDNDFPMVKLEFAQSKFEREMIPELQKLAEGVYENGKAREGLVFRSATFQKIGYDRLSFKVINLLYKG